MKKKSKKTKEYNLKQLCVFAVIFLIMVLWEYMIIKHEETYEKANIETSVEQNKTKSNTLQDVRLGIKEIPEYSDKIVIQINNDIPYFTAEEITAEDFEVYSNFDNLNRCGVAFANICKYTMPAEGTKRESLSYKPTGWNQYLYGENNSKHLYERCHLIAWQLGNENNNKNNLITGTMSMNSEMIPYENMVAQWIKEKAKEGKNYHVLYRVTPIFEGENKLATGVQMEAKSVEEDGVSFNIFIYNVQEGFEINYLTGEAKLIEGGD